MAASKESFTIQFRLEKPTTNTFKYAEQPEPGQPPRIGSLYVQKWALGEDPPKRMAVTVKPESA